MFKNILIRSLLSLSIVVIHRIPYPFPSLCYSPTTYDKPIRKFLQWFDQGASSTHQQIATGIGEPFPETKLLLHMLYMHTFQIISFSVSLVVGCHVLYIDSAASRRQV